MLEKSHGYSQEQRVWDKACEDLFTKFLNSDKHGDPATMTDEEGWNMKREYWLNYCLRCFGDKGDVEDITEGPYC